MRSLKSVKPHLIVVLIAMVFAFSCKDDTTWKSHYEDAPERVDVKIWDAIQDSSKYSLFIKYMKDAGFDTVLTKNEGFTLFIPTNEAFEGFQQVGEDLFNTMAYHISPTVLIPTNVSPTRKVQTFSEKFAVVEKSLNDLYFDGIKVEKNSPLFKDGTFYELSKVAYPRPNLYEYTALNSEVIRKYIDNLDSIAFDAAESTPLYFNEEGQTVYDSVYTIINRFELRYFPVQTESRRSSATFLLFDNDQYREALNEMADKLGDNFNDYRDIPEDWQEEVMMPFYMKRGLFDSTLTYNHFYQRRLMNIQGDSVDLDIESIDPASRYVCSNGVTFKYLNFSIPDSLFNDTLKREGEDLLYEVGPDVYQWKEDVEVSDIFYEPSFLSNNGASYGSVLSVDFSAGHNEPYSIKFKIPRVFPRDYNFRVSGVGGSRNGELEFYVNGKLVLTYDMYYINLPTNNYNRKLGFSIKDGNIGNPRNFSEKINWLSIPIDFITDYGEVEIEVKYVGTGLRSATNAMVIDYIGLFPPNEE